MITKLEKKIRDIINKPRRLSHLVSDAVNWNILCSALDLIGDTNLAVESYPSMCQVDSFGKSYLLVYGILQTFLLQQDATKQIANALQLRKIKLPKQLEEIRMIRNSAAGHPTAQKENGVTKSCFISRYSISPFSFNLITEYDNSNNAKHETISIISLIETQQQYVSTVLQEVVEELENQERKHKDMFKSESLSAIFHTSSYYIGKISEATINIESFNLGLMHVNLIQEILVDLKGELERRSEWDVYDSLQFHYSEAEYAINRLNSFFTNQSELNQKDAYIFNHYLESQLNELKTICKEIDDEYIGES